jgi:hypothetical protein
MAPVQANQPRLDFWPQIGDDAPNWLNCLGQLGDYKATHKDIAA